MLHVAVIGALLSYLTAAVLHIFDAFGQKEAAGRTGRRLFWLAVMLHTLAVCLFLALTGKPKLDLWGDYYFWLSWVVALLFLFSGKRFSYPVVQALVSAAIALLLVGSSLLVHHEFTVGREGADPFFIAIHVVPALFAEASLVFAFIVSFVFLLQERRVKRKSFTRQLRRGPSLKKLNSLHKHLVAAGFLLMTLSVFSGIIWAFSEHRPLLSADLVQWLALIAWVLLGIILHGRLSLLWSAKRVAGMTVVVVGIYFMCFAVLLAVGGDVAHEGFSLSA